MNVITSRLRNIRFPRLPSVDLSEVRSRASQTFRSKSLYARVTLSPFTLIYFLLAFLTCVIMVALQAVTFADNTYAINTLSPIIAKANVSQGFGLSANGVLQYCDGISNTNAAQCRPIVSQTVNVSTRGDFILTWRRGLPVPRGSEEPEHVGDGGSQYKSNKNIHSAEDPGYKSNSRNARYKRRPRRKVLPSTPQLLPTIPNTQQIACAKALVWLRGSLGDENREDIVALVFQLWLFFLAAVAILSESLPHLGAAIAGHILGTGWAGFRTRSSYRVSDIYQNQVVSAACTGFDPLKNWWQIKIAHTIPIVVSNGIALAFMLFLSYKIYKVYSNRTFSSVGATPAVERILKIVLLFSVSLHLTLFFIIASTAVWINKATDRTISFLAISTKPFLAISAFTLIIIFPWMYIGWVSVRRECRWRFLSFCTLSVFLLMMFTMMFWNGLYRLIFTSWPFFVTTTVTAYALVILSTILAIWCRFNFGRGFSHFIQVSEVLENMDFPSVYFSKGGVIENWTRNAAGQSLYIPPAPTSGLRSTRFMRASVYSNNNVATIKLSSSQPLHSEMVNTAVSPTSTLFKRTSAISVTQRLRRVFEYRRSNTSNSTSNATSNATSNVTSNATLNATSLPETTTAPASAPPVAQGPKQPILTSQIAQQARFQSSRPPPLQLREEDDNRNIGRGRKNSDKSRRRSRSVSLGRLSRALGPMETITEAMILDLPPKAKANRRPLPVRPLPKPPASAPLPSNTNASPSGAPLVRRGGIREANQRSDTGSFERQW